MQINIDEPDAAEQFWVGMREAAAAAAGHRDYSLYEALIKIGKSALAQGVELVPSGGLFLWCPVCSAQTGQQCINTPRHPLNESRLHPERTELAEKAMSGEVPLPKPFA